jgi:hypothetical protein
MEAWRFEKEEWENMQKWILWNERRPLLQTRVYLGEGGGGRPKVPDEEEP